MNNVIVYNIFKFRYKKCIEYLINNNYKYICEVLSQFGMIDYLKLSITKGKVLNYWCMQACGVGGNVKCLQFIMNNLNIPNIDKATLINASENNNIEILEYIYETDKKFMIKNSSINVNLEKFLESKN